jgi:uncharacterized protein YbjT (DUF2867 family)
MSDVLVTGGTGFVGANLVRELIRDGASVRVLARPGGDRRAIAGLDVEVVEGDLKENDAVIIGMASGAAAQSQTGVTNPFQPATPRGPGFR